MPLLAATAHAPAAEAVFHRAINLNGPPLELDGHPWEGADASNVVIQGKTFENQSVLLKPVTDPARARMIRSSVWGSSVDIELTHLPEGAYQVFLYVWEDNHSEQFDLLVNDRPVLEKFHSGSAGSWRKLGPWPAPARDGRLKVSARAASHGAANLSGIEVWAGDAPVPLPVRAAFVTEPTPEQIDFFERRIRPLFAEHCYECHKAGAKKIGNGLLLDSRAGIVKGGDSGPLLTPGDPEASLLIHAVRHTDPHLTMPPKSKLAPELVADLESWVRMGAPDPRTDDTVAIVQARDAIDWDKARQWWSFRPVRSPPVPDVKQEDWPANDIDRFILARLEQQGLAPASDASRRALLRRATYGLTGLPPSPEEAQAFLADSSPEAFERVVDRLLSSPHYGERWGRHWLDVVRYADTAGDNSDFPIPQMRRYRDWVIRAFNDDLPYDQFVREQLAGDRLPGDTAPQTLDRLVATGYIANARRFGSRVDDYPQHLTIEDTLDNLGRAFLGLSIGCARCHDHKFDPVTAADYYALYGIFQSTRYPWPGIELDPKQRDLVPLVDPARLAETEQARKAHDQEKRRLEKEVQKWKDALKEAPEGEKKNVEEQVRQAEQAAREFANRGLPFELAYAVAEGPRWADAPIQIKGDPAKPGETVPRRFLTVLGGQALPGNHAGSGRLELAGWITDPANPLTARVMVNRIWQHHFGEGLVPTPNDFGRQGKPPTHPELLDWLAAEFIASGWSIKAMHRLILSSRTYRQESGPDALALVASSSGPHASDPGHGEGVSHATPAAGLFSPFPRRRLEAEAIRDTLLVLGGNLDPAPAGPHPFPPEAEWKFTQHNPFRAVYESRHRSVYLMTQRIQRHPYLAIFDGADPSASTAARMASTTPLQALYLLNDAFVHDQAQGFAARILAASSSEEERLRFAWESALGRPPETDEIERARQFLQQARTPREGSDTHGDQNEAMAWQAMVRVLFRLNEFVYVD